MFHNKFKKSYQGRTFLFFSVIIILSLMALLGIVNHENRKMWANTNKVQSDQSLNSDARNVESSGHEEDLMIQPKAVVLPDLLTGKVFYIPTSVPVLVTNTKEKKVEADRKNIVVSSVAIGTKNLNNKSLQESISSAKSSFSATNIPSPPVIILLSFNRPVTSDVRGNLGSPSVVTNENVNDWLKDRWQAAKNMNGEPIPGEHWLEIDLQRVCMIHRLLIDWEDAYSDAWTLKGWIGNTWGELVTSTHARTTSRSKQHLVQEVSISPNNQKLRVQKVRLVIHHPSTRWGVSIWRLQLWGTDFIT